MKLQVELVKGSCVEGEEESPSTSKDEGSVALIRVLHGSWACDLRQVTLSRMPPTPRTTAGLFPTLTSKLNQPHSEDIRNLPFSWFCFSVLPFCFLEHSSQLVTLYVEFITGIPSLRCEIPGGSSTSFSASITFSRYTHGSHSTNIWRNKCVQSAKALQSCPTLCNPMNCSLPGSSVIGILPARILEWIAMPSSRGSSSRRDQAHVSYVSCIGRQVLFTASGMNLIFLDLVFLIYRIGRCSWIRESKFVATFSPMSPSTRYWCPLFSKPPVVPMVKPISSPWLELDDHWHYPEGPL